MNKTQLIDTIATRANIPKATVTTVINSMLDIIPEELAAGNALDLVGFGKFLAKLRAARTGRDPRTGGALQIPAAMVAVFKPGKGLKDAINAGNSLQEA